MLGFAHFYFHPSTFSLAPACMLEDLYVVPSARGQGVARQLIATVAQEARARGACKVHWKTRESNSVARALYEKLAVRSDYVPYSMALDPLVTTGSGVDV